MSSQLVSPHVLIVEDEPGIRQGIYRVLTQRGLSAAMAAGGEEALRLIEAGDFPLVLLDLKMPGMDGFELIARINRIRPNTICVVVSALATVPAVVKTTKMGTFDFVVKPFTPDELMVVVNRAIEKWRAATETERLRAEREAHLLQLTAEKSRLKTIMQSMADGLLVINIDGNIVLDNAAARMILGRISEPCICVPMKDVIPDSRVCEQIRELLTGPNELPMNPKAEQVKLEMALPGSKGGEEGGTFVRFTLAPFRDEKDQVLGVVVLLSDITDTKAYERMKNMFISMVAHEVKAPIAAIESYLNVIEEGLLDSDPKRIREIAGRCLERSGALLALVQDLLEISRRDTVQPHRLIEKLNVGTIASKLVEFHRIQAAERNLEIEYSCSPDLKPIFADAADLERMLTNLISNAIKYNRPGGKVRMRVSSTGSILRIEVEDTGIGMKPEEVKRAGEEFYRIKNEKTRTITGTGLGLSLVKRIVKSYHGELTIESRPDIGSIFRIALPLDAAENAPAGSRFHAEPALKG
jgi:two-component system, OmpR family, phosphate regulon sensor histidine kinase PhoR